MITKILAVIQHKKAEFPCKLWAPEEYWNMSSEAIDEVTEGCGPGGIGDYLVPDRIWGVNIFYACQIHDWMYHFGVTGADKVKSDDVFINNMTRIILAKRTCPWLMRRRLRMAKIYFLMVRDHGGPAFWNDKNSSNEFKEVMI